MPSANWRGVIGVIKPGYGTASLTEFIRLIPEGIGVIPMFSSIREHTQEEYLDAYETYAEKMDLLASIGTCTLLHPEGAPPFMLRGLQGEREIIEQWEARYRVPVFTSGMTAVAALRTLGVKRVLGLTYETPAMNAIFKGYFQDAGFDVPAFEAPGPRHPGVTLAAEDLYRIVKSACARHPDADGVYLQGSSSWGHRDIVPLEQDLGIPVLHPLAARVWYVQQELQVRQPVTGAGKLLEAMPGRVR